MHTISYVDLRCRWFNNKRKKYTISYKTYDIVCLQCRPTTSYTISTHGIVYDINLQTYDVVDFREYTTSHTTWISWNVRYRTSDLRCRMLHLRCSQTYDVVCSMSYVTSYVQHRTYDVVPGKNRDAGARAACQWAAAAPANRPGWPGARQNSTRKKLNCLLGGRAAGRAGIPGYSVTQARLVARRAGPAGPTGLVLPCQLGFATQAQAPSRTRTGPWRKRARPHLESRPPDQNTVYRGIYFDIPGCTILGVLVPCYGTGRT
jgi:hypothetical protein